MSASPDITTRITALHEWYCRNVMVMKLTPQVEKLWFDWLRAGYCGPDLRSVILYIRRQIALGKRNEGALKLSNLIAPGELGYTGFDQDLGLARARANLNVQKKLEPFPSDSVAADVRRLQPKTDQSLVTSAATNSPTPAHPSAQQIAANLAKLKQAAE